MSFQNHNPFDLENSDAVFPVCERDLQVAPRLQGVTPLEVTSHKAIIRADRDGSNPRTIGVVGSDYKVLRNKDYFTSMETSVLRNVEPAMLRDASVNTSTSFDGAWVQREYVFPAFAQELKTSSKFKTSIGFRIIGWNSYDGSSSAGCVSGLIDFYCKNGMLVGALTDLSKRRHTKNLTPNHFDGQIIAGIRKVNAEIESLRRLANTDLDMDRVVKFLEAKFSERRAKVLLDRVEVEVRDRGNNVFALHSALTYFASHNSEEFGVRATGSDNVAKTLHNRQAEIAKVMPAVYAMAA